MEMFWEKTKTLPGATQSRGAAVALPAKQRRRGGSARLTRDVMSGDGEIGRNTDPELLISDAQRRSGAFRFWVPGGIGLSAETSPYGTLARPEEL